MLESFLRYLRFLSKSTNQHGVHSPFVYSYLTEGIYNTKRSYKGYQKKRRLLQATIDYFQVKNILGTPEFQIDPNKEKANQFGKEAYIKLHYIKAIETFTKEELRELIKSIDENTILYIDSPNKSKIAIENWKALIKDKRLHVTIDFFIAGILFTRKEQRKEHFTLRV
ncbi:MAG TPA: hypothetical protein VK050_02995 [Flavobacteriaceae bacterium]|nr:hypothetical protein [Flavobacteriaceae bacterium]